MLGVVGRAPGAVLRRRVVRGMRIEEMNPGEPGGDRCGWRLGSRDGTKNPVACRLDHLRGSTVGDSERGGVRLVRIAVVVLVEPAAEPEARVEDEGADEGARPVAGSLEHGGQRR